MAIRSVLVPSCLLRTSLVPNPGFEEQKVVAGVVESAVDRMWLFCLHTFLHLLYGFLCCSDGSLAGRLPSPRTSYSVVRRSFFKFRPGAGSKTGWEKRANGAFGFVCLMKAQKALAYFGPSRQHCMSATVFHGSDQLAYFFEHAIVSCFLLGRYQLSVANCALSESYSKCCICRRMTIHCCLFPRSLTHRFLAKLL